MAAVKEKSIDVLDNGIDEENTRQISHLNLAFVAFVANLGSFLFGYDFGAISWLFVSIDAFAANDDNISYTYFRLVADSNMLTGLIAAGSSLGALVTYMFLLFFGNDMPKRDEIMLAAFLFFVGALLESSSGDVTWDSWSGLALLLAGRFVYGAGIATSFHSVPMYVSEVGPPELRGVVGSSTESMISTGVVVSYLVGYCYDTNVGWIVTFRVGYVVALIMGLLAMLLPQSPSYLVRTNHSRDEIIESLQFVVINAGESEIRQLQENLLEEKKEKKRWDSKWRRSDTTCCTPLWAELPSELKVLFSDPTLRRCLLLALGLVTLQMATGQGAILYFAGPIFEDICPDSTDDCIMGLGLSKLLGSYSMLFIADSFGRREFLIGGLSVMIAGMFVLCFGIGYGESIAAILGIYVAVVGYEVSLGTMLWILLSEIFPRFVRSAANSIAVSMLFAMSMAVTFALPFLEDDLGYLYLFVLFGSMSVFAVIVVFLFVPDTRGVDLEVAYKLVKSTCNASLGPVGLGIEEEDEDETEMLDDVSDSDASSELNGLLGPNKHKKHESEPVII